MLLVPALGPSSGVILEANDDIMDPEETIAVKLYYFSMSVPYPAQAAFFAHVGEGAVFCDLETMGNVDWHDFCICVGGIFLSYFTNEFVC